MQCPLLNISYCPASETDLSHGKNLVLQYLIYAYLWPRKSQKAILNSLIVAFCTPSFVSYLIIVHGNFINKFLLYFFSHLQIVVVYNPLGWKREDVIRIPVSTFYSNLFLERGLWICLLVLCIWTIVTLQGGQEQFQSYSVSLPASVANSMSCLSLVSCSVFYTCAHCSGKSYLIAYFLTFCLLYMVKFHVQCSHVVLFRWLFFVFSFKYFK